uniref:Protein kinase domain-containing protein n=1 Tax=Leersia perrieri TaxID=77586 RepID=A0A0D9W3E7_9ORYZ
MLTVALTALVDVAVPLPLVILMAFIYNLSASEITAKAANHPVINTLSRLPNGIEYSASQARITRRFSWNFVDQPTCADASRNSTSYGCASNHSICDNGFVGFSGYFCRCDDGYQGNPYVPEGCSRDQAYNPVLRKGDCSRSCGNITIPYPFGLEESCSARKEFLLNCTNVATSTLEATDSQANNGLQNKVLRINIDEGFIALDMEKSPGPIGDASNLFIGSSNFSENLYFAVANLTCQEAKQDITGYACLSVNSTCLAVTSQYSYLGYRCKCSPGFKGNPYIKNGCQDVDECQSTPGIAIGLSAGIGILLLGLSATLLIHKWRKDIQKQLRRKNFRKNQGLLLEQLISSDESVRDRMNIFTLEELEKATNNFDQTRILGRGGHGMVYKGILSDQRVVAIKKSMVIKQAEITQFINEVAVLSQINHRSIVKLFGCCLETEVPLLVYDFVSNGSLFELLRYNSSSGNQLSWGDAIRISTEVAGALYYLHSAASVSVFHRDVKSSNILLDANYTAKVSDFGTSRLVSIDQTHVITKVQGTFGYLDPEYCQTGELNEKSDVYSFGVVLLELLLKKDPVFTSEYCTKINLATYFLQEFSVRPVRDIVDSHIYKEATEEEINTVASLPEMCLRPRGEERPTMKQVEMTLQSLLTEISNRSIAASENDKEEMQPLLQKRAEANCESVTFVHLGAGANSTDQRSRRCYRLEQEFMASAELPR